MVKRKLIRSTSTIIVKRSRSRMSKPNTNQASFKLRFTFEPTSDGTGEIADFLSTSDPELAGNGSGVYNDWAALEALYDSYRVTSLQLHYSPYFAHGGTAAKAQAPCFIVQDNDDVTTPTSINEMIQYDRVSIRRMDQSWTLKFTIPRFASNQNPIGWLNVGNAGSQNFSSVKMFCSGLSNSTAYGRMVLTMSVDMKGKR